MTEVNETEIPQYRLLKAFYAPGDQYIPEIGPDGENTIIEWEGIPNPDMQPVNKAAEIAYKAWLDQLPQPVQPLEQFLAGEMAARPRYDRMTPDLRRSSDASAPNIMGNIARNGHRLDGETKGPTVKVVAQKRGPGRPKKIMGSGGVSVVG